MFDGLLRVQGIRAYLSPPLKPCLLSKIGIRKSEAFFGPAVRFRFRVGYRASLGFMLDCISRHGSQDVCFWRFAAQLLCTYHQIVFVKYLSKDDQCSHKDVYAGAQKQPTLFIGFVGSSASWEMGRQRRHPISDSLNPRPYSLNPKKTLNPITLGPIP